jgi:hypothetical protein
MRIIHCTQKLLKELAFPHIEPDKITIPTEGLGNWYCNLLRIDKRKCLLFTNEKTLYSFLIPKVKKENLKNIIDEFLFNLNMNLQAEGFHLEVITKVMQEYTDIGFAKTASRHVLGSMNELVYEYEYLTIHRYEGIENIRILGVNKEVNRTIMKGIKYLHPIESLQELLLGERQPRYKKGNPADSSDTLP